MFDITDYKEILAQKLANIQPHHQFAFSAWCTQALIDEFKNGLKLRIGFDFLSDIIDTQDYIWSCLVSDKTIKKELLKTIYDSCLNTDWVEENEETLEAFGCQETLEALIRLFELIISPSKFSASETAERVLNRFDFEICMIIGDEDPFNHPLFIQELEKQSKMIDRLSGDLPLSISDRRLYRTIT